MMTTAIRATIRPYSMAVAPDSSFAKRETNLDIAGSPFLVSKQGLEDQAVRPARPQLPRQFAPPRLMASKQDGVAQLFCLVYRYLLLLRLNDTIARRATVGVLYFYRVRARAEPAAFSKY